MFKRKGKLETDAAPSRPRTDNEMISSSDDEEDEDENDDINNEKQRTDDAPEFEKSNTFTKPQADGNTYVQTNNIHISNSSGFQIGNQYHIHGSSFMRRTGQDKEEPPTEPPPPSPPSSIKSLFTNRTEADEKLFLSIKFDIGPNWKKVADKLGLKEATIDQLHQKYKQNGISEVFYRLLLKWKEVKPRTLTTVGILCEALWNSGEMAAVNTLVKQHLR